MPKRATSVLAAAMMAAIAAPAAGQDTESGQPATGQIVVEQTETGYSIAALVTGQDAGPVMAELTSEKNDSAGRISSRQGSEVTLTPGQTETLAQSAISLETDGQIEAILTLSRNGVEFDRSTRAVIAGVTE